MIRRGDFVLCNFPFRESDGPGPSPHIVLCAATGREGSTKSRSPDERSDIRERRPRMSARLRGRHAGYDSPRNPVAST